MPSLNSPILSGDITGTIYNTRIEKLKGYPISTATPDKNQALVFDGSQWAPSKISGGGTNVELITATAGQTVFTLSSAAYVPGVNNLAVYYDGLRLILTKDYTETDPNTVTLVEPALSGAEILFESGKIIAQPLGSLGDIGTFTSYVSAPVVYGTHFGDGSNLTGIGTPNAIPLSGGNITGSLNVSNTFGLGTLTPAAKMHVVGDSRLQGNVTITGNLSCAGTQTFANTVFSTTSAVSVVNTGPGVALYVGNNGPGDIASFYDIDENVEIFHIGGNNGTFPNVGVKTSVPNKTFTVNGEISASQDIWTSGVVRGTVGSFSTSVSAPALSGSFFGDGSRLTGVVASGGTSTDSTKLPLSGGTLNGALNGTSATFSTSVSASALSGTHFGDGSRLTGVVGTDSTKLPLSGGTLNGALNGTSATFSVSVSAPALSGTHFGDGSRLTGITVTVANVSASRVDFLTTTDTKSSPSISLSAVTLDLAAATFFYVALNSNVMFTFANTPPSPRVFTFMLQLVGDGNTRTITWPAAVRWGSGTAPVPTSTLNKIDTLSFLTHDGGTNWFGFTVERNS